MFESNSVPSVVPQDWEIFLPTILEPSPQIRMFPQAIPVISSHIGDNDILNCRMVCNGWKQAVISSADLAKLAHHIKFNKPSVGCNGLRFLKGRNKYIVPIEKSDLYSQYRMTIDVDRDQYISSPIEFKIVNGETYLEMAFDFLDTFGPHICHLSIANYCQELASFMRAVNEYLTRVPNLRRLVVSSVIISEGHSGFIQFEEHYPLKYLANLKQLKLDDNSPKMFYEFVMETYSEQLESIEFFFPGSNTKFFDYLHSVTQRFMNLKELHVSVTSRNDINHLIQLRCPLITLRLFVIQPKLNVTDLLLLFRHFGKTVQTIRLEFHDYFLQPCRIQPRVAFSRMVQTNELTFPQIKLVSIQNPPFTIDLLLSWFGKAGLPKLHINWEKQSPQLSLSMAEAANRGIQLYGWLDRMYDSNIWQEMPSLKEITLEAYRSNAKYKWEYNRDVYTSWTKAE